MEEKATYVFDNDDLQLARYGQEAGHGGVEVSEQQGRLTISCMASLQGQCVCWRIQWLVRVGCCQSARRTRKLDGVVAKFW